MKHINSRRFVQHALLTWVASLLVATASIAEELQLTLPPVVYAVPNLETAIYFDNIVLAKSLDAHRFKIECGLGKHETGRWTVTPTTDSRGDHAVTMR